jgi:hypothetical protein
LSFRGEIVRRLDTSTPGQLAPTLFIRDSSPLDRAAMMDPFSNGKPHN